MVINSYCILESENNNDIGCKLSFESVVGKIIFGDEILNKIYTNLFRENGDRHKGVEFELYECEYKSESSVRLICKIKINVKEFNISEKITTKVYELKVYDKFEQNDRTPIIVCIPSVLLSKSKREFLFSPEAYNRLRKLESVKKLKKSIRDTGGAVIDDLNNNCTYLIFNVEGKDRGKYVDYKKLEEIIFRKVVLIFLYFILIQAKNMINKLYHNISSSIPNWFMNIEKTYMALFEEHEEKIKYIEQAINYYNSILKAEKNISKALQNLDNSSLLKFEFERAKKEKEKNIFLLNKPILQITILLGVITILVSFRDTNIVDTDVVSNLVLVFMLFLIVFLLLLLSLTLFAIPKLDTPFVLIIFLILFVGVLIIPFKENLIYFLKYLSQYFNFNNFNFILSLLLLIFYLYLVRILYLQFTDPKSRMLKKRLEKILSRKNRQKERVAKLVRIWRDTDERRE